MRAIVATFADADQAQAFLGRLHAVMHIPRGVSSIGTVAAYGEPYDGHRVVAAWVPDDRVAQASRWVIDAGGVLNPQPAVPPSSVHPPPAPCVGEGPWARPSDSY